MTAIQRRILTLLSDGLPHRPQEIHACLDDDLAQCRAIRRHLTALRQELHPLGETILCVIHNRTMHYQLARSVLPSCPSQLYAAMLNTV